MAKHLTERLVRRALKSALADAGTYAELSRRVGISDEYVRQVAIGQRPPRGELLAFLGFQTVIAYDRLPAPSNEAGE